jgi:hypothetical protein
MKQNILTNNNIIAFDPNNSTVTKNKTLICVISPYELINFVIFWWKFNNPALSTKTKRWLMICIISPLFVQFNSTLAQLCSVKCFTTVFVCLKKPTLKPVWCLLLLATLTILLSVLVLLKDLVWRFSKNLY